MKLYKVGDTVKFHPFDNKKFKTKTGIIQSITTKETKESLTISYIVDVNKDLWVVEHESIS